MQERKINNQDAITLYNYLRIVWKWKWFIIAFTLVCSMLAAILSIWLPKIYEASMIIEPGVIDIKHDGKYIYIDSPSNISSKISAQVYNDKISEQLDANFSELKFNLKAIQPKDSNAVKVRLETSDVGLGIQILTGLLNELKTECQHYIDLRKLELDRKIALVKNQLNISDSERQYLEKEITLVNANTQKIVKERNMLVHKEGNNVDRLSLLIYTNIIQQNIAHYNDLNKELAKLIARIAELKSDINKLGDKRASITNIRVIQPPKASLNHIRPKTKLNVIAAFFIGFIISIFLTFFFEYLKKMKNISSPLK